MFLVSLKVSTGSNLDPDTSSSFRKNGLGSLKDSCCAVCGAAVSDIFLWGGGFYRTAAGGYVCDIRRRRFDG